MSARVKAGNVSMYPQDWAVLDAFAEDTGLSRSAALRIIVREWKDLKRHVLPRAETMPQSEQDQDHPLTFCPQCNTPTTGQPNAQPCPVCGQPNDGPEVSEPTGSSLV